MRMADNRMLKFVTVPRVMPDKRSAGDRREDFHEIYAEYAAEKAAEQAGRCSQCGVPYCQTHCPLHNNIPDWLMLTAEGRLREAYELSQATNTFPEICGRICPQDRLCEGNCVIEQSGHGTVTIGAVEKYLTDMAWEEGWVAPVAPRAERAESGRRHRRRSRRSCGGRDACGGWASGFRSTTATIAPAG
jgi:glutamate synthase (NADPH) small chain